MKKRKESKAERRRKTVASLTVPKMEAHIAKEAKAEAAAGKRAMRDMPKDERLDVVDRVIRMEQAEVKRDTKRINRYGGSDKAVAFGRGVHSGLNYAGEIVHSANRGKLVDRKGRTHKQRRGSVI